MSQQLAEIGRLKAKIQHNEEETDEIKSRLRDELQKERNAHKRDAEAASKEQQRLKSQVLEEQTRWKLLNENLKGQLEEMEAREREERRLLKLAQDEQNALESELQTATMNYSSLEEKAKEKDEEILQLKLKLDKLQKEIDFANNVIQLKEADVQEAHVLLEEAENGSTQREEELKQMISKANWAKAITSMPA